MYEGYLQVSLNAGTIAQPIDNGSVSIIDESTGKVLNELKTNSSGITDFVELETPPEALSLGVGDARPYSVYTVRATGDGFGTTIVRGVQILPNSNSLQPVSLRSQTTEETIIDIPESRLYGDFPAKIPEAEVKPLPTVKGLVVLPAPVIPEYIVVHLGRPENYSARNVWVPYIDYLKNVGSSEIYATWPLETLKANILAINSFALNRVYTEWYRGKGFDFQITNNTAFDQAFQYGRTIYKEISQVVDDLFTTFATKPGIRQPLFTMYCDGRQVNCDTGMQQWGSKDLGAQGYTAIQILRHYYGNELYLTTASKVSGVPQSFGGTVLKQGSYGSDVRTIQLQLNAISNNFPKIPKLVADGVYGPKTANSVKIFQEIFNLPQTGSVDFSTWYRISNVYVAVSKLAELQ